jgi:A/G-specific adenine glycosylase
MLEEAKIAWFRFQLRAWVVDNWRDFPWRQTSDPYAIFVAELLLQKTEATLVVPIYEAFISRYPNFKSLATAPLDEVKILLKPLGLFFRAERLCRAAQIVVRDWDGTLPNSVSELIKLPGVGKYTARSLCANAFGQSQAILDTNVARILERFFGIEGDRVKSRSSLLWQAAERVAPETEVGKWNLTLLDFGATVCTAKNPLCHQCPLREKCDYFESMTWKVIKSEKT